MRRQGILWIIRLEVVTSNPVFSYLCLPMVSKITFLQSIKACIAAVDSKAEVILFGSRARGDARKDSDWDLLILTPGPVDIRTEQRFRHKLFELEIEYGQAISTRVYSKEDWAKKQNVTPLFREINKEGVAL
jgi:predicted nucleotidyltransferase